MEAHICRKEGIDSFGDNKYVGKYKSPFFINLLKYILLSKVGLGKYSTQAD